MAKLIQQIKYLFTKEVQLPKTMKAPKARTVKKKVRKQPTVDSIAESLQQIKAGIEENGYYSTTVGALFKRFGIQKRHAVNIKKVIEHLEQEGLYTSTGITLKTKWSEKVQLHSFPVAAKGDLFESENQMEILFEKHKWYKQLNLTIAEGDRQYKPKGTRDRLDFKARDKKGNLVVLELKHKDGDKRLIEQAFRYRSLLNTNFPDEKVKCVIITGSKCIHTARAIHGLSPKKQKKIKWYTYHWDSSNEPEISFEEVRLSFINSYFTPAQKQVAEVQEVQ